MDVTGLREILYRWFMNEWIWNLCFNNSKSEILLSVIKDYTIIILVLKIFSL